MFIIQQPNGLSSMLQPTFAAVVRTPLGLIPLFGYLIINFIFIFCVLFFLKQLSLKKYVRIAIFSYLVALAGLFVGLYICAVGNNWRPPDFYSFENMARDAATWEGKVAQKNFMVWVGFILSTIAIFCGHFFLTFGKKICKDVKINRNKKLIFSSVLTVLNAPYLLFVTNDFLILLGYTEYY